MKYLNEILNYYLFHKTALFLAIEKENVEIVKFLLCNDKIDVNIIGIFNYIFDKILFLVFDSIFC